MSNTQQQFDSNTHELPLLLGMTSLKHILEIIQGMEENLFSFVRLYFHNNTYRWHSKTLLKFHKLP